MGFPTEEMRCTFCGSERGGIIESEVTYYYRDTQVKIPTNAFECYDCGFIFTISSIKEICKAWELHVDSLWRDNEDR
jgi:hypothetical protein